MNRAVKFLYPLFLDLYCCVMLKLFFKRFSLIGDSINPETSVIVLSNHISWWDGVWNYWLIRQKLNKCFHFIVAQHYVDKYRFLRHIGAISFGSNKRDFYSAIYHSMQILEQKEASVLIYSQPKLNSAYTNEVKVRPGVDQLYRVSNAQLLMVAYFSELGYGSRPTVCAYCRLVPSDKHSNISDRYQQFYSEALALHINRFTE